MALVTADIVGAMFATTAKEPIAAAATAKTGAIESKFSTSHVIPGTTDPVMNCTASRSGCWKRSYTFSPTSSNADPISDKSPPRLSVMMFAMSCAASPDW